jgi:phage terminase small subunit
MAGKADKLSPKERAFARAYVELNEGKAAAIKAGYSKKTAEVKASQLLRIVKVKLEIKRLIEKLDNSALMSVEEADRRLSSLARVNFKDFFDSKGALKQMAHLTDEQAYCLKEVTSQDNEQIKIKTNDPLQALRTIYERRGLLKNQVEGTLKVSFVPSFGDAPEGK